MISVSSTVADSLVALANDASSATIRMIDPSGNSKPPACERGWVGFGWGGVGKVRVGWGGAAVCWWRGGSVGDDRSRPTVEIAIGVK